MSTALVIHRAEDLLAKCDEREVVLPVRERRLLKSMAGTPIRDMPAERVVADCRAIVASVMMDVGIARQPTAYDGARFYDTVREYFSDLTVADLKQAFEFYCQGMMDDVLPKSSDGETLSHFQQFSQKWYSRILREYRRLQLDAKRSVGGRVKVLLMQEAQAKVDPYEERFKFIEVLKSMLLQMRSGNLSVFILTESAEFVLRKAGILPKEVKPQPEDIIRAKERASKKKSGTTMLAIHRMIQADELSGDFAERARNIACHRIIRERVMELGDEGIVERMDKVSEWYKEKRKN